VRGLDRSHRHWVENEKKGQFEIQVQIVKSYDPQVLQFTEHVLLLCNYEHRVIVLLTQCKSWFISCKSHVAMGRSYFLIMCASLTCVDNITHVLCKGETASLSDFQ
jgi:hypothetical protein